MKSFIVYDTAGRIARTGICQDLDFDGQAIYAGEGVMEGSADGATQYVLAGNVMARPANPASVTVSGLTLTVVGAPAGSVVSIGYKQIAGLTYTAGQPPLIPVPVTVTSFPAQDFETTVNLAA